MNNSMNFFKRLTAFLLALLLLTTMMGDDFFSLADEDFGQAVETVEQPETVSAPEPTAPAETVDVPAQETPAQDIPAPAETGGNIIEPPADNTDGNVTVDENGVPVVPEEITPVVENQEETPEDGQPKDDATTPGQVVDEAETPTDETIEIPEEVKEEPEECEHVDEDEDGICDLCGEQLPKEEKECEHGEYEYISNGDGTHVVRCKSCGEDLATEACHLNDDGICELCGYEDNSLVYQSFSKTIFGTTVTVEGDMPRKASVEISYVGKAFAENIVNSNIDDKFFKAYAAYDINIYNRHGEIYQPVWDDNTVKVTCKSVDGLEEVSDEDVAVFRIEDFTNVTEIPSDASGEDVSFDAEHFTIYTLGEVTDDPHELIPGYASFAYINQQVEDNYIKVNGVDFYAYLNAGDERNFTVSLYKNVEVTKDTNGNIVDPNPMNGTLIKQVRVPVSATSTGKQKVTANFDVANNENAYIARNSYYSVVVQMDTDTDIIYGNNLCPTYFKQTSGKWSRTINAKSCDGIFGEDVTTYATAAGSYTVNSLSIEGQILGSDDAYHVAVGDTLNISAGLADASGNPTDVERQIEWELVSGDAVTKVTGSDVGLKIKYNASKAGKVTIKASYGGTEKTITVAVLAFKLGNADAIGETPATSIDYLGKEIGNADGEMPFVAYSGPGQEVNTDPATYPYIDAQYYDNENAGEANVHIIYYVSGSSIYEYDRYFTINALKLTPTIFANVKPTIVNGNVTKLEGVSAFGNGVVPSLENGDYSAEFLGTESTSSGLKYTIRIRGSENFVVDNADEYFDITPTVSGSDISTFLRVRVNSTALSHTTYNGKNVTLNSSWSGVTFLDQEGNTINNIVTPSTANVTISNKNTSDGDARNAGTKTITFTMKDGESYTGSVSCDFELQKATMTARNTRVEWKKDNNGNDIKSFKRNEDGSAVEPKCSSVTVNDTTHEVVSNEDKDFDLYFVVSDTEKVLINPADYNVSYEGDRIDVGDSAKIKVTGKGGTTNFEAVSANPKNGDYSIAADYALDLIIRITADGKNYDGKNPDYNTGYEMPYSPTGDTPTIKAYLPGYGELSTDDYEVNVYDDENCTVRVTPALGKKYIKITGKNTYATQAAKKGSYTVVPKDLTHDDIVFTRGTAARTKIFTGQPIKLTTASTSNDSKDIKIVDGTSILQCGANADSGKDYYIEYSNNTNRGNATYTIKGIGNYKGEITGNSFTINPASLKSGGTAVAEIETKPYQYNGKQQYPKVTVRIGSAAAPTFTEEFVYDETTNSFASDNFIVTFPTDCRSPGVKNVTVTGRNNLRDSQIVPFTISTNKDPFTIFLNGTQAICRDTNTTPRVYTCDTTSLAYKGSPYINIEKIYGKYDSENPLVAGQDYYITPHNNKNAKTYNLNDTASSPYYEITGLGMYDGNNAIVYFNIAQADISKAAISDVEDNIPWSNDADALKQEPTVKFNNLPLTKGSDYTVNWYNYDSSDESMTTFTTDAGVKCVVVTGVNNFKEDSKLVRVYTVGEKLEGTKVTIKSGWYATTTNEEVFFANETNRPDTNPFEIPYRSDGDTCHGKAPIIELSAPDGSYIVSTPTSSLGLTGSSLYDARESGSESNNYNLLSYTISPKKDRGYYGPDMMVYVRIMPQSIDLSESSGRISLDNHAVSREYNGEPIILKSTDINVTFKYGDKTNTNQVYVLNSKEGAVDYKPSEIEMGTEAQEGIVKDVTGVGNYTGIRRFENFTITKGNISVYLKKSDGSTPLIGTTTGGDSGNNVLEITDQDVYVYTGTEIEPKFELRYANGDKPVKESYTVQYHNSKGPTNSNETEAVITIPGPNLKHNEIIVKYTIKKNTLDNFKATIEDKNFIEESVKYVPVSGGMSNTWLKESIANGTTTIKLYSADKTLKYGADGDYVIAEASDLDDIRAETGNQSETVCGVNDSPSYGKTAWVYVKGVGVYSGFKKVYFNIVLDLSSAEGSNGIAKVYAKEPYYELKTDGTTTVAIEPVIRYRKADGTYGTLANTSTVTTSSGTESVNNYVVSRERDKKPGPDETLAFVGQYACTGTARNIRYVAADKYDSPTEADKSVVYFLADLTPGHFANNDIEIAGDSVFIFDGTQKAVTLTGSVLTGATLAADNSSAGDYTIVYKDSNGATVNQLSGNVPIEPGKYIAEVKATSGSKYFMPSTSTGNTYVFYVKYDLSTADMKIHDADGNYITRISYTGNEFTLRDHVIITVRDEQASNKIRTIFDTNSGLNPNSNPWIEITPTSVKDKRQGDNAYTVSANRVLTYDDYVMGSKSVKFEVTGPSIADPSIATFSIPSDTYLYKGGPWEPKVTGTLVSGNKPLVEGTDFTVRYANNVNHSVGTKKAKVYITGKGAYECDEFEATSCEFTIDPIPLTDSHIVVEQVGDVTYSGRFLDTTLTPPSKVELTPTFKVYYKESSSKRYELQVQATGSTAGDVTYGAYGTNRTDATESADYENTAIADNTYITIKPGPSGNTTGEATAKYTIKQLDLNEKQDGEYIVKLEQETAEYTGQEINIYDLVKLNTKYVDDAGKAHEIKLWQDVDVNMPTDRDKYDYTITIKDSNGNNITTGKIKDTGTYTIEITGHNSCKSKREVYFTITPRSLQTIFHYYYSPDKSDFVPKAWEACYDKQNHKYTCEYDESDTVKGLKVVIEDVPTITADNNKENMPPLELFDMGIDPDHALTKDDYTVTLHNNQGAGSARWNRDGSATENATIPTGTPYVEITGTGLYTGTIQIPYNIGKNITSEWTVKFTGFPNGDYTYANVPEAVADHYVYDGTEHKPDVEIVDSNGDPVSQANYTLTYTDNLGNADDCVNAGYKYVVVTGKGNYCGVISQKFAVDRKPVNAQAITDRAPFDNGSIFSNETKFVATGDDPVTAVSPAKYTFTVDGTQLSRFTSVAANKNSTKRQLVDTGIIPKEEDAAKFFNYYFAVYDGEAIEPTVSVVDNEIKVAGEDGTPLVLGSDYTVTWDPNTNAYDSNTASTFTFDEADNLISYKSSEITVTFKGRSATDFENTGNYYVGDTPSTFKVKYLILPHNIASDFNVQFDSLNGNNFDFNKGLEIKPADLEGFEVKRGSYVLRKDVDYEVTYKNNITPGEAELIVTGKGNFRNSKTVKFYIWGNLADTEVYHYDDVNDKYVKGAAKQLEIGKPIEYGYPEIYLGIPKQGDMDNIFILQKEKAYTLGTPAQSPDNFITEGTVYYNGIFTGDVSEERDLGFWKGEKGVQYFIKFDEKEIKVVTADGSKDLKYKYTGEDIKPKFSLSPVSAEIGTITFDRVDEAGNILEKDTTDFKSLGLIKVTIPYSIGNITGKYKTATYEITERPIDDEDVEVVLTKDYPRYTGRAVTPAFKVWIKYTDLQTNEEKTHVLTRYDNEENPTGEYAVDYGQYIYGPETAEGTVAQPKIVLTGVTDEITGVREETYDIKLHSVSNLRITDNTGDTVTVDWVCDPAADGTKLVLQQYDKTTGQYDDVMATGTRKDVGTYTFTKLSSSTKYRIVAQEYAVTPDNHTIYSDPKDVKVTSDIELSKIKVTRRQTSPTKVTITLPKGGDVLLYYVYECRTDEESDAGELVAIIPASTAKVTLTGLKANERYFYYLEGYGADENGDLIPDPLNHSKHTEAIIK